MYQYSDSDDDEKSINNLIFKVKNDINNTSTKLSSYLTSNSDLIQRLELTNTLQGHRGCVNTVEWNDDGNLLVSGSDDRQLIIWNKNGEELTSFDSGHNGNIFAAKFMNSCNDSKIASGAADGSVCVNQWKSNESGICVRLHEWNCSRRVKQVVLDYSCDDSFFSCSEDGKLYAYDIRSPDPTLLISTEKDEQIKSISTCLYKPTFIAAGFTFTGVKIYDLRNMKESLLNCATSYSKIYHNSYNISPTYVQFNKSGTELIVNMHNDAVYIFDVTLDNNSNPKYPERLDAIKNKKDVITEPEPKICMNNPPFFDDEYKIGDEYIQINNYSKAISLYSKCITYAEMNIKNLTKELKAELAILYQLRGYCYQKREYKCDNMEAIRDFIKSLELYPNNKESTIGIIKSLNAFKQTYKYKQWKQILNERFGEDIDIPEPSSKVKTKTWNAYTMKLTRDYSQRFLGARNFRTDIKQARFYGNNNEYVIAGSDCGHMFIWERSTGNIIKLLKADDNVLNCVVPHPYDPIIATSGIEKFVRIWTPWVYDDKEKISSIAPETSLVWLRRDATDAIDDIVLENMRYERRVTPLDFIRFATLMEERGQFHADCRPS